MKAKTLLISAMTLGVLVILAGCEAEPGTLTDESQPGKTMNSNALVTVTPGEGQTAITQPAQSAGETMNPAETVQRTAPAQAIRSEADMAAYQAALNLNDTTYCDKIKDEAYKTECKTALTDQAAQKAALDKLDAALCSKLSTADKQEACKITVQAEMQRNKESADYETSLQQQSKLLTEITASGNTGRCPELKDSSFVNSCISTIITQSAVRAKDIKECDKATTDSMKQSCIDLVKGILALESQQTT